MTNEANQPFEVPALLNPDTFACTIVVAQWNSHITTPLLDGALQVLKEAGVAEDAIRILNVPGSVELVNAAAMALHRYRDSAVIVLGCVIRGETPHFDYVCQSVTQGVTMLNCKGETPVIFGLVTTENEQQALDRAGGRLGNKGAEAAATALAMANMHTIQ